MKLILSRKGFDGGSGGCPSPIMPDGTLVSLPIPSKAAPKTYDDVEWARGRRLGELIRDLAPSRVRPDFRAHLDPDLNPSSLLRPAGWRPLFGQLGPSQSHLANQGVGPGDLFLFFGLYRRVIEQGGRFVFERRSKPVHVLFGWLQVESMHLADQSKGSLTWGADHPHFHMAPNPKNVVYVSRQELDVPGVIGHRGAGLFGRYSPHLQLTARDAASVSEWRLPAWFEPTPQRPALTFHSDPDKWIRDGDHVRLRTVGRGQEFVLNTWAYPEMISWLGQLFSGCGMAPDKPADGLQRRQEPV